MASGECGTSSCGVYWEWSRGADYFIHVHPRGREKSFRVLLRLDLQPSLATGEGVGGFRFAEGRFADVVDRLNLQVFVPGLEGHRRIAVGLLPGLVFGGGSRLDVAVGLSSDDNLLEIDVRAVAHADFRREADH